jgi:ubiquinone biosynthesis monooxygenase Coq6
MKSLNSSCALALERRFSQTAPRAVVARSYSRVSTCTVSRPPRAVVARSTPRLAHAGPSRLHSTAPPPASVIPEISVRDSYDIVIIGGGNAGLALACALRKSIHRFSVIRAGATTDE